MAERFYAGSVAFSGVAHFETEYDRDEFVAQNEGAFPLERGQVDPEVRRELESAS